MADSYAGFIDVGFLHAEGARKIRKKKAAVRLQAAEVVRWLQFLARTPFVDGSFLRAYWYDAAFGPEHPRYRDQRKFLDAIAHTPGIHLRLGHLAEHPSRLEKPIRQALASTAYRLGIEPDRLAAEFDRHWTFRPERRQKGVDTLIALDMVRLAGRSVFSTAVLIAGDRDLAEVVRTTQDFGVRTLVATPDEDSLSNELAQLADEVIVMNQDFLERMIADRDSS